MRDTDFTSMDEMNKSNMDLNTAMKDNWQEANEAQSYNLLDDSGRYSEKNDYIREIICKLLQQQAAPHVDIEKFDDNLTTISTS